MEALMLVDIQNDFCTGGALEVPEGEQVVPVANKLIDYFEQVVATQDWHPPDHGSFASQHTGKKPFETGELAGMTQILWPDHCVQYSKGAAFHPDLRTDKLTKVIVKGTDREIDSYSGFFDNGHRKATGLDDYLKANKVDTVYIMGLAADVCVYFTTLDALKLGYNTYLIRDGIKGVDMNPGDTKVCLKDVSSQGAILIDSKEIMKLKSA